MNLDSGYFIHTLLAAEKALQIIVMKQFKDTRYWVTKSGEVWKHWPRIEKTYYSTTHLGKYKDKTIYIREEKYKQLKPQLHKAGYSLVTLYFGDGKISRKCHTVHRIVAELYTPGYFKGAHVDHIDCNNQNNHYTNLQWCTKEYNSTKKNNTTFPLYSEWSK